MCFWYWAFPHHTTQNYHHPLTLPTQSLQLMNSLPIGPRTPPPLTSLMLSRQIFRLKIITFLTESCGDELLISAENNTSHWRELGKSKQAWPPRLVRPAAVLARANCIAREPSTCPESRRESERAPLLMKPSPADWRNKACAFIPTWGAGGPIQDLAIQL